MKKQFLVTVLGFFNLVSYSLSSHAQEVSCESKYMVTLEKLNSCVSKQSNTSSEGRVVVASGVDIEGYYPKTTKRLADSCGGTLVSVVCDRNGASQFVACAGICK